MSPSAATPLFQKLRKTLVVLFYAFVFLFFFYHANKILDPDFGWHLRAGADSIAQGKIINQENYNFPILGDKWINHEWLADILAFALYDALGYIGLTLVFATVFTLTLVMQYRWIIRRFAQSGGISPFFWGILAVQLFGMFAMLPQLGVRMQVVTLPLLVIEVILLDKYTIQKRWQTLAWMPLLFVIWANLHGSFLIGIMVFLLWILVKIFEMLCIQKWQLLATNPTRILTTKEIPLLLLVGTSTLLATLLTPHGVDLYYLLTEYTDHYYQQYIIEWLPAWRHPVSLLKLSFLALVSTVVGTEIVCFWKHKKLHVDLWLLILTIVFLLLAFESKRHFPLLYVIAFPLLLTRLYSFLGLTPHITKAFQRPINHLPLFLLAITGLVINIAQVSVQTIPIRNPFTDVQICEDYPCAAITFLQDEKFADKRIFNSYGWGGYLLWMMPQEKIFIDGRQPQKKINNKTFLEEYHHFFNQQFVAQQLQQYNVELVLLKNNSVDEFSFFERHILRMKENTPQQDNALMKYLRSTDSWEQIYQDKVSLVFARKDAE